MSDPLAHLTNLATPQVAQADPAQVLNHAGGYSFALDPWDHLTRFLVLGTAGGTYYVRERDLTAEGYDMVVALLRLDGPRVVAEALDVSVQGRAQKQNSTIFTLALAALATKADGSPDHDTRKAAYAAMPQMLRTGSMFLMFMGYTRQFRGGGPALHKALQRWYTDQPLGDLGFQLIKYRERNGFNHGDAMRLVRPKAANEAQNQVFRYAANMGRDTAKRYTDIVIPEEAVIIAAADEALHTTDVNRAIELVRAHRLPWETINSDLLRNPTLWDALVDTIGITAVFRNLARMTSIGLITPGSEGETKVLARIGNTEALTRGRVHPMQALAAMVTYRRGRGSRGNLTWAPSARVLDALDAAFYTCFGNVTPANKRTMLCLDVSGSMATDFDDWMDTYGAYGRQDFTRPAITGLTPRDGSAAMALVTAATEPSWSVWGFSTELIPLPISPRQRLDDAIAVVDRLPFGRTDISLPMVHALRNRMEVDTFVVYTDNETYAGRIHPHEALRNYRNQTGINARLVVVGMVANNLTVADPADPGQLDVVGFDTATPDLISAFSRGEV